MVARRRRLVDRGAPMRAEAGEQDARLHLCAGDGRGVVDPGEPRRPHHQRRAVACPLRLDPRPHGAQGFEDPAHRARTKRGVAGEATRHLLARHHPGQQADAGARVAHVEVVARRRKAGRADSLDLHLRGGEAGDPCPQRRHGARRVHRVLAGQKAVKVGAASGEGGEDRRPVGDRLVARDAEAPADPPAAGDLPAEVALPAIHRSSPWPRGRRRTGRRGPRRRCGTPRRASPPDGARSDRGRRGGRRG